jgi:hypothetical protein
LDGAGGCSHLPEGSRDLVARGPSSWSKCLTYFALDPGGACLMYQDIGVAGPSGTTVLTESTAQKEGFLATHDGADITNPWGGTDLVVDLGKAGLCSAYLRSIENHYAGHAWSGIFADDTNAWYNLWARGEPIDGYSSPSDYWARAVIPLLHCVTSGLHASRSATVIPNIGEWPWHENLDNAATTADGGHDEFYLMSASGEAESPSLVEAEYREMRSTIAAGKLWLGEVHPFDPSALQYASCAAAIMGGDSPLVRVAVRTTYGLTAFRWDPLEGTKLGSPTDAVRHAIGSPAWSRSFANGDTLAVDTAAKTCTVRRRSQWREGARP